VSNGQVIQLKLSKVKYLNKGQVSQGKSSILDIGHVKRKKKVEDNYSSSIKFEKRKNTRFNIILSQNHEYTYKSSAKNRESISQATISLES